MIGRFSLSLYVGRMTEYSILKFDLYAGYLQTGAMDEEILIVIAIRNAADVLCCGLWRSLADGSMMLVLR